MSLPLLIGIDLGTTGCRTIIFDRDGRQVAKSYVEYEVRTPETGWAEQDPEQWWSAALQTIREAVAAAQLNPADVVAIGVTAQQPSPVFVDSSGCSLAPSLIWMDRRTTAECEEISTALNADHIYSITGLRVDATFGATKILWVRKHWPDVYKKTYKIIPAKDFLVQRLTGEFVTDYATSAASLLLNIRTLEWWDEALSKLDIPREKLATLRKSTDLAGKLRKEVAVEVGLVPGTPVFTGAGDSTTEAIGCRVVTPGEACASIGTSCDVIACTETPPADPKKRFVAYPHAVANRYVAMAGGNTGGMSLRWFRDQFCQEEIDAGRRLGISPYALMDLEAARTRPGAGGVVFLPYLLGERSPIYDPLARGVFFGISLRQTRADFIRAVMEGVACSIRHRISIVEEQGIKVPVLNVAGGGASSALWRQIIADVTGRPNQTLQVTEGTCVAAAILAGVGAGLYSSVESACAELLPVAERCEPNSKTKMVYDSVFQVYVRLYESTKALWPAVNVVAQYHGGN
ncbi:MAG: xylulokinase [Chloroflexi bacterium]|nr:xylulokinase [Chloroflexota bacterium]